MRLAVLSLAAAALFAQPGAPQPSLLPCGMQGDAEVICGTKAPEDFEITPDGKFLVITQFVRNPPAGLALYNLATKQFSELSVILQSKEGWGEGCPGPLLTPVAGHGSSLVRRKTGQWQLYIVNHAGRESIEMYELTPANNSWFAVWRGCVVSQKEFNDVAALDDGSFYATHPTALETPGVQSNLQDGHPSGYVVRWEAGKGETELEGTRFGYPNGILASKDGRTVYYASWTNKALHKYTVRTGKDVTTPLTFMPDNLTFTARGQILAAGIQAARGTCGDRPCIQVIGLAQVNPLTFKVTRDYKPDTRALLSGTSVALQVGTSAYVGAFSGDRMVKIPWK